MTSHPSRFNGAHHLGSPEACPVCEIHRDRSLSLAVAILVGFLLGAPLVIAIVLVR